MRVIGDVIGGAGGALVSQLWKLAALVLGLLLLVVGIAAGTGWWLAASARDKALADLVVEQGVAAELRAGISTQNRAIMQWYEQAKTAEARGEAAWQAAATSGRRYDQSLQQLVGARATSCADAMPYVNQLLGEVKN